LSDYAAARQRRDGPAEASYFSENGDFRGSDGRKAQGRREIAASLGTPAPPNYTFSLTIDKVRFLTPEIALVDATAGDGKMAAYVMSKANGDWLITAARIALPPPKGQ